MGNNEVETRRWLAYARSDLDAAQALLKEAALYARQAGCLAHQAAEKSIKAALLFSEITLPRTDDLDTLRNLLPAGWALKATQPHLASLSVWSVETHCLTHPPEIVVADALAAMALAQAVFGSISAEFAGRGLSL